MKHVWKTDRRGAIISWSMSIMCFAALEIMLVAGIVTRQVSFTATALYIYIFCMVGVLLYQVYEAGAVLLRNLRNSQYFKKMEQEGLKPEQVMLFKFLLSFAAILVLSLLYLGTLIIDLSVILRCFEGELEAFRELNLMEEITGGSGSFVPALLCTILEYICIWAMLLMLAYAAVTLTYTFFLKQRFAGLSSIFVYVTIGWLLVRINTLATGGLTGIGSHAAGIAVNAVLAAVLYVMFILVLKKKTLVR